VRIHRTSTIKVPLVLLTLVASLTQAAGSGLLPRLTPATQQPESRPRYAKAPNQDPPPNKTDKKDKQVKEDKQDKQDNPEEAVRLRSRLVLVPVSASDSSGQPVKDLKAEDLSIEEEGRRQQVEAFGEPGKTPVEIALLLDVSGSTQAKFGFEQQAAVQFIRDVLRPGDGVSIFSIGKTPNLVRPLTAKAEEAIADLRSVRPSEEPTAFFDAIVQAAHSLDESADPASRRVVVVISDGEENYSVNNTLASALKELQKDNCLFYSINPTGPGIRLNKISLKGQSGMDAMATQTGGKAFVPAQPEELAADFRQIAAELQAQYLFGYYAGDEKSSVEFRRITVRAPNRPDLRIRARQGYYVREK
jgi:Ca-activated chloride channel family protein